MRSRRVVAGLSVAALVALFAASCDDHPAAPGSGGSGGAGAVSSSASGGHCKEVSADHFVREQTFDELDAEAILTFGVVPAIDGGKTAGTIEFLDRGTTKTVDLGSVNESNYGTCTTCVKLTERSAGDKPRKFFQQSGTLDLGDTRLPAATGKLTDVTLVEVTIDEKSFVSTAVKGGACLHLAEASFSFAPAPPGWTCEKQQYDDHGGCDCECGAPDPDCKDPSLPVINGCQAGQTCKDGETCGGVPSAWTCDPADYAGGAGNGCQCGCGTYDPDCDLSGEAIIGCAAGDVCNHASACVPPGWTCDPDTYADGYDCDCMCGLIDPDCKVKHANVVGCAFGQRCPADVCTGAPPGWTCDPADYAGGPGNGCNCGCGVYDPDCDSPTEAVIGCAADESCDFYTCYPNAWVCDPDRYADGQCDCGCGVVDIDCADDTLASCVTCSNPGSCSTHACPGNIDPNDNATCL